MTKAQEALDSFNKGVFVHSDAETIREALELLDKVQRGGVEIGELLKQVEIFYCDDFKRFKTASHVVKTIGEKYILIERDK